MLLLLVTCWLHAVAAAAAAVAGANVVSHRCDRCQLLVWVLGCYVASPASASPPIGDDGVDAGAGADAGGGVDAGDDDVAGVAATAIDGGSLSGHYPVGQPGVGSASHVAAACPHTRWLAFRIRVAVAPA